MLKSILETNNFSDAVFLFRSHPEFYGAYREIVALVEYQKNGSNTAKIYYERALQINPIYVYAILSLAKLMMEDDFKDFQGSKNHHENALELNPNCLEAHHNFATLLGVHLKDFQRSKHHYEKALELNPNYPEAHNNFANLLQDHFKDIQGSKHHYEKALELNPNYPEAHYNLANLLQYHPPL